MPKKVNPSISVAITKDFGSVARELEEFCNEYLIDRNEFIRRAIKEKLRSFKSELGKTEKTITTLKPASSYLVKEDKAEKSFALFKELLNSGVEGLCFTRQHPQEIKEKYNLGRTTIFWLSKEERDNCITPSDLGRLAHTITEFIQQRKESIIALEGLEYLITHNDFDKVVRLVDDLAEKVVVSKSRIVISASPETFDEKQLALLERNLELLEVKEE